MIEWLSMAGPFIPILLLLIKPVRGFLRRLWRKTLGKRGQQLNRIEHRLDAELTANGGSSIKDVVGRIEERQHQLDAFLRTSLNIHDIAIFRANAHGKVIGTNREYKRMTGASIDEVRGDGWINVVAMGDRDRVKANWEHAVEEQREYHDEITMLDHHGKEFTASVNVYKEVDCGGILHGFLGVVVPVHGHSCAFKHACLAELSKRLES